MYEPSSSEEEIKMLRLLTGRSIFIFTQENGAKVLDNPQGIQ